MRIAMLCHGTRGDIQPHMAIAAELRARGHEVVIATNVNHADTVRKLGLEPVSYPVDFAEFMNSNEAKRFLANGRTTAAALSLRKHESLVRSEVEDAMIAATSGADVVVSTPLTWNRALSLTESYGQRHVRLDTFPVWPTRAYTSTMLTTREMPTAILRLASHRVFLALYSIMSWPDSRSIRRKLGLKNRLWDLHGESVRRKLPVVGIFAPALYDRPADWPAHVHVVEPPKVTDEVRRAFGEDPLAADPHLEAWLADGEAPVYFGFGSLPVLDPHRTLQMIRSVARDLGVRALVGAGWSEFPAGPQDDGRMFISSGFNHDAVLPRCRAAVHHGGAGTTNTVARAGIPEVIAHVITDQQMWANNVVRVGVGERLPFQKLNRERLKVALEKTLGPQTVHNAKELALAMSDDDGTSRICDLITGAASDE